MSVWGRCPGTVALPLVLTPFILYGCTFAFRGTMSGFFGSVDEIEVDYRTMSVVQSPGSRVYYPEGASNLASRILSVISLQAEFLRDYLGVSSENFAVAICRSSPFDARYVVLEQPRNWHLWALPVENFSELSRADEFVDVFFILLHERTENAVVHRSPEGWDMYDCNKQTRWIGDGLAELVAYRFCQRESPIAALEWLEGRRRSLDKVTSEWNLSTVNLRDFQALRGSLDHVRAKILQTQRYGEMTAAYYAASFYYWASLEEDEDSRVARELLSRLHLLENPTNEEVNRLMEALAGSERVGQVECLNLSDAILFIEREIRNVIPRVRERIENGSRSVRMAAYEALRDLDAEVFGEVEPVVPTTGIVFDLLPGSPAFEVGLRRGDVVECIDGQEIDDFETLQQRLPGVGGTLKILRGGAFQEYVVPSLEGCKLRAIAK